MGKGVLEIEQALKTTARITKAFRPDSFEFTRIAQESVSNLALVDVIVKTRETIAMMPVTASTQELFAEMLSTLSYLCGERAGVFGVPFDIKPAVEALRSTEVTWEQTAVLLRALRRMSETEAGSSEESESTRLLTEEAKQAIEEALTEIARVPEIWELAAADFFKRFGQKSREQAQGFLYLSVSFLQLLVYTAVYTLAQTIEHSTLKEFPASGGGRRLPLPVGTIVVLNNEVPYYYQADVYFSEEKVLRKGWLGKRFVRLWVSTVNIEHK